MDEEKISRIEARLSESRFRSRFHLLEKDKQYVYEKGLDVIEMHARDIVTKRLSNPPNDGKQTPMKGHPVFIAQHATACCCRSCLEKWHKIDKYHVLTNDEIDYITYVIMRFIKKELIDYKPSNYTPSLCNYSVTP